MRMNSFFNRIVLCVISTPTGAKYGTCNDTTESEDHIGRNR